MASPHAAAIDELYQLPLAEFTAARNTLAKGAGAAAPEVRALTKPPLPAWAVNQLYWKRRQVYDALVQRAEELRDTHKAILTGRRGDLRTAGKAHDEAVDAALKATLSLLEAAGERTTDATRQAIASTLRALPSHDAPGRLGRVLQPGGFEMLAGITPVPAVARESRSQPARAAPPKSTRGTVATSPPQSKADQRALARAREAAANAAGMARQAEQAARQHEFEAARAGRDAEKAARRLAAALEAVEAAQLEAAEAERQSTAAARKRDTLRQRTLEAQQKVRAAHERASAAESEVAALSRRSDA
ncbi:MAG: hypothetical protein LC753_05410 [Acidobacteria bacterium]|nr:hypothetical protein [Acidobacteriota bacterium]MCA1649731.1 hypothetical protein [Acidobacteriota bacterium]